MTKQELLMVLKLLSALESWSFSTKNALPDYLSMDVETVVGIIEREILN